MRELTPPLWLVLVGHTSFPCFCRNSISCCVNVVMEIDFTLCGGFNPRRLPEQEVQTKEPTVMFT